jgi:hypothetical protein
VLVISTTFETTAVQKIKTHYMLQNFFRKQYHLSDNVGSIVEPIRSQITTWCMRFAYGIPKGIEYLLPFQGNTGYENAPQSCVINTLPVLFDDVFDYGKRTIIV